MNSLLIDSPVGRLNRHAVRDTVDSYEKSIPAWVHVLAHLHPKYGGVSAVVPQLDAAIAGTSSYAVRLAAFCEHGEEYMPAAARNVQVQHFPLARSEWRANPKASHDFATSIEVASGVHIHGLWQRSTSIAASSARSARKPYVVSAHGMLEPWALANKRWKKRLYMALVENANLRKASCLHALTLAEAKDYRRLGLRNPIAIIPNGVEIPRQPSSDAFLTAFPDLSSKRIILFLGRIHFKKGLDILCRAWARLCEQWPDAQLVLAGPDFEGTQATVEQLVSELGLTNRVTFTGMLTGEKKWSALTAAEFFVLPSYSEGLSVSILEAMGMGKPVLITENCNLPEVGSYGCGLVVKATCDELVTGLNSMLAQSPTTRAELGNRGKQMVQNRYSWQTIGHQMAGVYRWLEGGPEPADVELDRVAK